LPNVFLPWTTAGGSVCSGTPLFGRFHATQWVNVPLGASGSVMISARSFVPFGALPSFSGGEALSPSHVKPLGIGFLVPNAGLVTLSFLTFAGAAGAASVGETCAARNITPPVTATIHRSLIRLTLTPFAIGARFGRIVDMADLLSPAAVVLDYYGTLAHATHWISADDVLAQHGYELPPETRDRWFNDAIDGIEHLEHSQSRDHYMAWQRERILGMLAETDVHPGEYEMILEKLRDGAASRVLEAYPEVPSVLEELRVGGMRLGICSNWAWDLTRGG